MINIIFDFNIRMGNSFQSEKSKEMNITINHLVRIPEPLQTFHYLTISNGTQKSDISFNLSEFSYLRNLGFKYNHDLKGLDTPKMNQIKILFSVDKNFLQSFENKWENIKMDKDKCFLIWAEDEIYGLEFHFNMKDLKKSIQDLLLWIPENEFINSVFNKIMICDELKSIF